MHLHNPRPRRARCSIYLVIGRVMYVSVWAEAAIKLLAIKDLDVVDDRRPKQSTLL